LHHPNIVPLFDSGQHEVCLVHARVSARRQPRKTPQWRTAAARRRRSSRRPARQRRAARPRRGHPPPRPQARQRLARGRWHPRLLTSGSPSASRSAAD
jgi:hypothetical protein